MIRILLLAGAVLALASDADVVRLARDPDRPWEWRKTPTRLRRLPVGTFVVIIGRKRAPRVLEAERIVLFVAFGDGLVAVLKKATRLPLP